MSNTLTNEQQLIAYAREAEAYRVQHGLTKAELLKRFPRLGSDRTFGKLISSSTEQLNVEDWLPDYEGVVDSMRSFGENAADEVLWDDLSGPKEARRAATHILTTTGNDRFCLITGESGMGKSAIVTLLRRKYPEKLVILQAACGMTDSAHGFYGQLMLALDSTWSPDAVKKLPVETAMRLAECQSRLNRKMLVCIEEGQDLGPGALKAIKTLINTTKAGFILVAIPTLWQHLARRNFEDARQLTANRNAGVIKLGMDDADIVKVLDRRCKGHALAADKKRAVARLKEAAAGQGYFKFLTRALNAAVKKADGQSVTLDHIEQGLSEEQQNRGLKKRED